MALKPDRNIIETDISYFMSQVAERGGVVCLATGATLPEGASMDNSANAVEYATNSSGRVPVGLLLTDVVNIDQSRQHLNQYKNEVQIGDKVTVLRKGWVVTNRIPVGQASGIALASMPAVAYLGNSGFLYSAAGVAASGFPVVGRFLTMAGSDQYAKVAVDVGY